jgi:hypothetical protein
MKVYCHIQKHQSAAGGWALAQSTDRRDFAHGHRNSVGIRGKLILNRNDCSASAENWDNSKH